MEEARRMTVITPRIARRYLRDIEEPHLQFRTRDGHVLKNLIDLAHYLKVCDAEAFRHHVGKTHNHLSSWVHHTITDCDLAQEMSLVLEKNPMRIIVMKRVNVLVHHATRNPSGPEKARMILESAQLREEVFVANDGRTIRDIWELKETLKASSDHLFSYHCAGIRNDFAEWVAEVLMDYELARHMTKAHDQREMAQIVEARISELEAFRAHKPRAPTLSEHINLIRGEHPARRPVTI